jgi:transposase
MRSVSPIDAEAESDQVLERVAAIDVAKASAMVCVRVPHPSIAGRRLTRVWEVRSTTNAIIALAEQLVGEEVERVVVESTSDYWRPFLYLLEAQGLTVWLVNARDVKQVPGRPKTDKLDAVWLAKRNERGMLRRSFVPPAEIRRLRDYTRLRVDLIQDRSRQVQRLEKLLEDALIKLSSVVSDITGASARAMIDALIAGERNPQVLAELARGALRGKRAALVEALTGRFDDHHAELAQMLLDEIDALTAKAETLTIRLDELIAAIPAATAGADPGRADTDAGGGPLSVVARLDEITGVGIHAAHAIIAEVGLDVAQFPTPAHLASWSKVCPRTIQSGPKTPHRQHRHRQPLPQTRTRRSRLRCSKDRQLPRRALYRRLVRRRGKLTALVAIERSILIMVWHLLADPSARYHDLGADFYARRINKNRRTRTLVRQLEALGHHVTLQPIPIAG